MLTWLLLTAKVSGPGVPVMLSVLPALLKLPPSTVKGTPAGSWLMLMVSSPLPVVMLAETAESVPERSIVLPVGSVPSMATVVDAETVLDAESVTLPTASSVTEPPVLWTRTPPATVRSPPEVVSVMSPPAATFWSTASAPEVVTPIAPAALKPATAMGSLIVRLPALLIHRPPLPASAARSWTWAWIGLAAVPIPAPAERTAGGGEGGHGCGAAVEDRAGRREGREATGGDHAQVQVAGGLVQGDGLGEAVAFTSPVPL